MMPVPVAGVTSRAIEGGGLSGSSPGRTRQGAAIDHLIEMDRAIEPGPLVLGLGAMAPRRRSAPPEPDDKIDNRHPGLIRAPS
jgi:hypothetical protein